MEETAFHRPVLLRETVEQLEVRPGGVYVDATVGEGGHGGAVLAASAPGGVVLGIDRDPRSMSYAKQRLSVYGERFIGVIGNYADMVELARGAGLSRVDGVLLDLGFSSRQVLGEGYGFSFQKDEPLDMRYNPATQVTTAAQVVNTYAESALVRLFYQYGEEPRSRAIARLIVQNRPIATTRELAELASRGGRPARRARSGRQVHPATRVFQALRIEVNEELANLERGLAAAIDLLKPLGRLVVISYHSLEDRLVKNTLAREAAGCICPPQLPQCVCQHRPTLRLVNRRIIRPAPQEVAENPRSRSARMRVAQRI